MHACASASRNRSNKRVRAQEEFFASPPPPPSPRPVEGRAKRRRGVRTYLRGCALGPLLPSTFLLVCVSFAGRLRLTHCGGIACCSVADGGPDGVDPARGMALSPGAPPWHATRRLWCQGLPRRRHRSAASLTTPRRWRASSLPCMHVLFEMEHTVKNRRCADVSRPPASPVPPRLAPSVVSLVIFPTFCFTLLYTVVITCHHTPRSGHPRRKRDRRVALPAIRRRHATPRNLDTTSRRNRAPPRLPRCGPPHWTRGTGRATRFGTSHTRASLR